MHILESFDNLVDLRDETRVRFRDVVLCIVFNAFHETVVNYNMTPHSIKHLIWNINYVMAPGAGVVMSSVVSVKPSVVNGSSVTGGASV